MAYENYLSLLVLLSPVFYLLTSFQSFFQPGIRPHLVLKMSQWSGLTSILTACFGIYLVYTHGSVQTKILDMNDLVLSVRLDPLSMLLFTMIALLSFVIIKFSRNYLDGDNRQGAFIGRLTATIASVQLLVLSGSLIILFIAWVCTSLALHKLLVFYSDRPRAVAAAKKKFIIARIGDACLLGAIILLYQHFNSWDLEVIFNGMKSLQGTIPVSLEMAALLLSFAALLKSAQFPTHGWLIEVMETPTPVSALLHAGLLNAGPFLMARMAFIIAPSELANVVLITFGGITAFFASVTFLTQSSVKTALGYSSVAHMGFMLLVCGMGVFPAAMLHLVAHSFYKAHAFLSSGSAIDVLRSSRIAKPIRNGNPIKIIGSIVLAVLVYLSLAMLLGVDPTGEFALIATGAIVVLGLTQIIAPALDSNSYLISVMLSCGLAIVVALAFFSLEGATSILLFTQLPQITEPGIIVKILIALFLLLFSSTVIIQILAPVSQSNAFWQKLGVHFRNGWYANAWFDRVVGAWDVKSTASRK